MHVRSLALLAAALLASLSPDASKATSERFVPPPTYRLRGGPRRYKEKGPARVRPTEGVAIDRRGRIVECHDEPEGDLRDIVWLSENDLHVLAMPQSERAKIVRRLQKTRLYAAERFAARFA